MMIIKNLKRKQKPKFIIPFGVDVLDSAASSYENTKTLN